MPTSEPIAQATAKPTGHAVPIGSGGRQVAVFDGASDVGLGDIMDDVIAIDNAQFSVSFKIKPASVMTAHPILGKASASTGRQWFIRLTTGSKIEMVWYTNSSNIGGNVGSSLITDTDRRYSVVVSYDGNQGRDDSVTMTVDGVSESMSPSPVAQLSPTNILNTATELQIGSYFDGASYFDGEISDVKFVDDSDSSVFGFWPLNGDFEDKSGAGNDGINNGVTFV